MDKTYWSKVGEIYGYLVSKVPCGFVSLEETRPMRIVKFCWRTRIGEEVFSAVYATDRYDIAALNLDAETYASLIAEKWRHQFECAKVEGDSGP